MISIFIEFFLTVIFQNDGSLILAIVIIIISIQLYMLVTYRMPSKFVCPRCHSDNIIEYDEYIECVNCQLHFSVDSLRRNLESDDIMSEEELDTFFKAFKGVERKKLYKILKDEDEF